MDAIVRNLGDLSWWFTGAFFAIVSALLPAAFSRSQRLARKNIRQLRARSKRRVKNVRGDPLAIIAAIGKANAQFTVFLLLAFGYGFGLLLLGASYGGRVFVLLAATTSLPVFVMEIAWLNTDSYVKELLKGRAKLLSGRRGLQSMSPNPSIEATP